MAHETLADALAAFQAELPVIVKDNVAKVQAKSGASYSYSFSDLSDISPIVLPLLGKQGLAWTTEPVLVDGQFVLRYALMHGASGQERGGYYPLPHPNTPAQEMGGAITYARRYTLLAVTGVAPGDDAPPPTLEGERAEPALPSDWKEQVAGIGSREDGTAFWTRASQEGWLTTEVQASITEQVKKVTGK